MIKAFGDNAPLSAVLSYQVSPKANSENVRSFLADNAMTVTLGS